MKLTVEGFADGERIPERFAFGVPDPREKMKLGPNRNPALRWEDVPDGTRSFVVLCVDPDAPTRADDVNREGRTVSKDLPRTDFHHWVMVDVPPHVREIAEGACSDAAVPKGKHNPSGPPGARQGLNDYTSFLQGNPAMAGRYFGYDGPCPPWNDEIAHRYRFVVLSTDLARCPVEGEFDASAVKQALGGHVLAEAIQIGVYSLNPKVGV